LPGKREDMGKWFFRRFQGRITYLVQPMLLGVGPNCYEYHSGCDGRHGTYSTSTYLRESYVFLALYWCGIGPYSMDVGPTTSILHLTPTRRALYNSIYTWPGLAQ